MGIREFEPPPAWGEILQSGIVECWGKPVAPSLRPYKLAAGGARETILRFLRFLGVNDSPVHNATRSEQGTEEGLNRRKRRKRRR